MALFDACFGGLPVRLITWLLALGTAAWFLPGILCAAPDTVPRATRVKHPEWSRNAVIYELNTRQFTPEGTFRAILPRIPELKALGVKIVWFMPIHPIGEKGRKGDLGSPYAVRDYYGVSPELGTLDDFKAVVRAMHDAGLHVIIDLVANHTSWDNPLTRQHPSWYARDGSGQFCPPEPDWLDVIKLDYFEGDLHEYMAKVMEYWVRDVGVDGFRCDVANMVPTSFWNMARQRLDAIRPVFMLAEAEKPELLANAFDCDYGSEYFRIFDRIARNRAPVARLDEQMERDASRYPPGSWRLMFTTNHDQNAWLDSDINRLGAAGSRAFAVLAFTMPGKPLIYNGQEIGNPRKLPFFTRGPIEWKDPGDYRSFYTRLCHLYSERAALHSGSMVRINAEGSRSVFSFFRSAGPNDDVLVVVNLSNAPAKVTVPCPVGTKELVGLMAPDTFEVVGGQVKLQLPAWGYHVFECKR